MTKDKYIIIVLAFLLGVSTVYSQKPSKRASRLNAENFFGVQFRPLIPMGLVGDKKFTIGEKELSSTITPLFGYSYGAAVRVGLTELLAIETGLNYTKRRYLVEYEVADSSLYAKETKGFVSFEVPVNFLVYIKLGSGFYMNTAVGASLNFNPSNIRTRTPLNPHGMHLFIFEGKRYHYFDFHANAEIGFEYRTERAGTFYLGMQARVPFTKILQIATEYRHDTHKTVAYGDIGGATFGLAVKYFFPNGDVKKSSFREKGPIEF